MTFTLTIKTAEDRAAEALAMLKAQIVAAVDARVEAQARALGYNDAAACAGYANSTVGQWAAEAQAFIAWRDAVWLAMYQAQDQLVQEGGTLSLDAVLADLPVWGSIDPE
ncbi:hypothetical protein [Pararhodobacter zhoushanensis]|uniref:hypothetical protein n=1 Tax=Pararhodobacter zhoushanensis TaxID=2479545 RepID=UPI000F8DC0A5|nr:hypothetical protein [Pararhodobacter zhoushanensis]